MARIEIFYLVSLMIRSWGIAVIAGISTLWIRKIAVRHAIWVAVMIAMLLMPLADAVLPYSWFPSRVEQVASVSIAAYPAVMAGASLTAALSLPVTSRSTPERTIPWWSVAAALYALVAMALFMRLGFAWWKIAELKRRSDHVHAAMREEIAAAHGLRRRVPQLRQSASVRVPITIGFLQPVVILPAGWDTWDEWKLRAVLAHEFAHVRRWDWIIAAIAAFNQCLFWLNPLSTFLKSHLSELAERACDDAALRLTNDAARYAEVLLQFSVAHNGYRFHAGGMAMAKMNMKARIERVLRAENPANGILKRAGWGLVLMLSIPVLYASAAIQLASDVAPTPSYSKLATQLSLPHAPNQAESLKRQSILDSHAAMIRQSQPGRMPATGIPGGTAGQQQKSTALRNISFGQPQVATPSPAPSPQTSPRVIVRVEAIYPPALQSAGVSGSVLLSVTIGSDGSVVDIKTTSATNPLMAAAASDAVRQWVFQPTIVDGKAVTVTTEISINFNLPTVPASSTSILNDQLLALPGYPDDLLAYLQNLASLRGSIVASRAPFSFVMTSNQTRKVSIQAGGSTEAYECSGTPDCRFVAMSSKQVLFNSFNLPGDFFGVLIRPANSTELTLLCLAQQCIITSVEDGKNSTRTLKTNESATFSSSATISGTVN